MLAVAQSFPLYVDLDGAPLDAGSVFFGQPFDNPETMPIPVCWDAGGTQPVAQPARTLNGYIARAGTPASVFIDGDYSIIVRDRAGRMIHYCASAATLDNSISLKQSIDGLRGDLSSTESASVGAGMVGYDNTANYVAGTPGAVLQDAFVNVIDFLDEDERQQVKAAGALIDLTPRIGEAKGNSGNRPMYVRAKKWSFSELSCLGWNGGLVGDGMASTVLTVRDTCDAALDIVETTDVIVSPLKLSGFTLDANSKAGAAVSIALRHHYELSNLLVQGATTVGVLEKDTWLGRHRNVRITDCPVGWHLVGSNHGTQSNGTVITGCSTKHLLIEQSGSAADGNDALGFYNLTVSDGSGDGVDDNATSSTYVSPYLGENISGVVFIKRGGTSVLTGGVIFFGHTAASYLISPFGGLAIFDGVRINGQEHGSIATLSNQSGGKFMLRNCQLNIITGGDQVVPGDPIAYGPAYQCFAPKYGKGYTHTATNCTVAVTDAPNQRTWTVTAASAGAKVHITASLIDRAEWIEGAPYLVITYASTSAAWNVRCAVDTVGTAPVLPLCTLQVSSGIYQTCIKVDGSLDGAAYTLIDFYNDDVSFGASLTINSVHFSDGTRMPLGNLWKC